MPETTRTPEAVTFAVGPTRPHPRATDRQVTDSPPAHDGGPYHRIRAYRGPATGTHRTPVDRTPEDRTPTNPPRERGTRTPDRPHPTTRRSATRHHRGVRLVGGDRWSRPSSRSTPRHG